MGILNKIKDFFMKEIPEENSKETAVIEDAPSEEEKSKDKIYSELQTLKRRFLDNEISVEEYNSEKEKIEKKLITKIETKAHNEEKTLILRSLEQKFFNNEITAEEYNAEKERIETSEANRRDAEKIVKKIKLKIKGMHCESCAILLTKELGRIDGVKHASVNYAKEIADISYSPERTNIQKFIKTIQSKGYNAHEFDKNQQTEVKESGGVWQLLILIGILAGLYFLSKYVPFTIPDNIGLLAAFGIGLLISFHCVGMCSSFVTSYSLKAKEEGYSGYKIHLMYNFGRVLSYTIIGGILGLLGSAFIINQTIRGYIAIFAGVFMILFALSLMGLFRMNLTPTFIYKIIGKMLYTNYSNEDAGKAGKGKGPFVVGLMNGLMPCGPLIAMELYALGTGNFFTGAGVMMFFGLGTVPAMFGLGTVIEKLSKDWTTKMLKISGIVILALGLLTISRGLAFTGTDIGGLFSSIIPTGTGTNTDIVSNSNFSPEIIDGKQVIKMDVTASGYSPNKLLFKPGVPIKWIINAKTLTGCNREIVVRDYGLDIKLKEGENIVEFTPKDGAEKISFSCWMGMIQGAFVSAESSQVSAPVASGGSCGGSGGGCGCGGAK